MPLRNIADHMENPVRDNIILGIETLLDVVQKIDVSAGLCCDPLVLERLRCCQSLIRVCTKQALDKVTSY